MSDKNPRKDRPKKIGKSLKEKRAAKKTKRETRASALAGPPVEARS